MRVVPERPRQISTRSLPKKREILKQVVVWMEAREGVDDDDLGRSRDRKRSPAHGNVAEGE